MAQVTARQQDAQKKLDQLNDAYLKFISEWEKIEKEEKELLREMHRIVDKEKIQKVLTFIDKHGSKH